MFRNLDRQNICVFLCICIVTEIYLIERELANLLLWIFIVGGVTCRKPLCNDPYVTIWDSKYEYSLVAEQAIVYQGGYGGGYSGTTNELHR